MKCYPTTTDALLDEIAPLLVRACECMDAYESSQAIDTLEDAACLLERSRNFLELHRPPVVEMWEPKARISRCIDSLNRSDIQLHTETTLSCKGDPSQIFRLLHTLLNGIILLDDSELMLTLYGEDETPCLAFEFDGPGRIPDRIPFGSGLFLSMEAWCERWTAATHGGRVDQSTNGLVLRLEGIRMVPEPVPDAELLCARVRESAQRARTACIDGTPEQMLSDSARSVLDSILSMLHGPDPATPADLSTLLTDVIQREAPAMVSSAIRVEVLADQDVPAIAVHRALVERALSMIHRCARTVLERGGELDIILEYSPEDRSERFIATISGTDVGKPEPAHMAFLRHVAQLHYGSFTLESNKTLTLHLSLADSIALALDDTLPGWDCFEARSCRMLRLLKTEGQIPPEDLILAGVLDRELEIWLLPHLESAPAVNCAYEMLETKSITGKWHTGRLKKALEQISKGKPRKELAKPEYASEILWAYARDARYRAAIGAGNSDDVDLKHFAEHLMSEPLPYIKCLRDLIHVKKS